jgi:CBS domain-containing protein
MARYGMDFGRWGGGDRYDREQGFQGRDRGFETGGYAGYGGYGGMRSDGWGSDWRNFAGESGWFGDASPGYQGGGYDGGYGGSYRRGYEGEGAGFDRGMQGSGYGGGYSGRDIGYGGFDYERNRYGGRWGGGGQGAGRGRDETRAAQLMTENPECVTPDTSLQDVARKMRELNVGIIPVVDSMEGRRLQGVITDRDIAIRAVAEGKDGKSTVGACMTSDVETVNKNDRVGDVLMVMEREQVRRVPVTDREGRLVGIIAQADLAVDFAGDDMARERMVEDTIQRISEPARPRRTAMAARNRGGESGSDQSSAGSSTGRGRNSRQTET